MLKTETLSKKDTIRFTFSGDLGVAAAAELQQQLLKTETKTPRLEIKTERIENMDLSFLQLLLSWAKEKKQSGKSLTFDFRMDEEFKRIFEESGFKEAFDQL
ncbi:MAG TPA: STAS domain-containing protein [Bacteroidetes bacterium]|nr:STAS domain-containing protein [Bacteroidota bacterium]